MCMIDMRSESMLLTDVVRILFFRKGTTFFSNFFQTFLMCMLVDFCARTRFIIRLNDSHKRFPTRMMKCWDKGGNDVYD